MSTSSRIARLAVALMVSLPAAASAQSAAAAGHSWELLFSSGALVPTGAARNTIKDAPLSTAQLSYVMGSRVAITSTFGWARSRDLSTSNDPKLDVFSVDLGGELRAPRMGNDEGMTLMPFIGAGTGLRSYNYRGLDADATHNIAGYASVGGNLGMGRVSARIEVRDYVTGFKPLQGAGVSATRNDVVALIGLRFTRGE